MPQFNARESRFSARALQAYAATNKPEMFALKVATADSPAEILLYDEIGPWGITAKGFLQALMQAGDGPITVRINSPGGDAFDGVAIYNALVARTAPVNVVVDGLAASAASYIAMAGDTITMAEQSFMMVHKCWGLIVGNSDDLLSTAATMEKIDGAQADIFAQKTGKTPAEVMALLAAETWLTAAEAKENGFCTAVAAPQPINASSFTKFASGIRPDEKPEGTPETAAVDTAPAVDEGSQAAAEAHRRGIEARKRLLRLAEAAS